MAAEIIPPLGAPREFTRGDTVKFRVADSDHPAPDYTATLSIAAGNDHHDYSGTDYGDGTHLLTITAAQSAVLEAGALYSWQVRADDGAGEVQTLARGQFRVLPDLDAISAGYDDRTEAARIYDAIGALLERKASVDQSSMAVGGKSLSRYTWDELMNARGRYAWRMTQSERLARNLMPRRNTRVRFL